VIFFGWLCTSIAVVPRIEVGLEQDLSVPEDSHVLDYFHAMYDYLSVGPPVYFVVRDTGLDYSNPKVQDQLRAGGKTYILSIMHLHAHNNRIISFLKFCIFMSDFPWSLVSQIFAASRLSNRTYIAKPSQSWLDDYVDWSAVADCCKYNYFTGYFCPSQSTDP
jgi:Niemann-Pick C1 protein